MRRSKARPAIVLTVLLMGALLAPAAEAETIRAVIRPPNARKSAPAFSLVDASGKTVRLADYRGKIVLLNFWAVECGGCRLELPSFVELDQAYKGSGLVVLGVSMDISYEDLKDAQQAWSLVKPFVQTHGIKYQILMGTEEVTKLYGIEALPLTHLIDGSGRIAASYEGVVDKNDLEANIKSLLKAR